MQRLELNRPSNAFVFVLLLFASFLVSCIYSPPDGQSWCFWNPEPYQREDYICPEIVEIFFYLIPENDPPENDMDHADDCYTDNQNEADEKTENAGQDDIEKNAAGGSLHLPMAKAVVLFRPSSTIIRYGNGQLNRNMKIGG